MDLDRIFNDSFDRVTAANDGNDFFGTFRVKFLAASVLNIRVFEESAPDFQAAKMNEVVVQMLDLYVTHRLTDSSPTFGIDYAGTRKAATQETYDDFMRTMIDSVHALDTRFSRDVALAWFVIMAPGMAAMRFNCDPPTTLNALAS